MANTLYTTFKQSLLSGANNLSSVSIKAALVTASYTPNFATDQYWSSAVANVVGTPQALTSVTVTGGVLNAASVTYTAVTGSAVTRIVLYIDTGVTTTSQLICADDTATGLPVTPNGGNITITWDSGANKIFAL